MGLDELVCDDEVEVEGLVRGYEGLEDDMVGCRTVWSKVVL